MEFKKDFVEKDYNLISVFKDVIYVFEKEKKLYLVSVLKPSDNNNKNFISIQTLKEIADLFFEALNYYKNVVRFDFILTSFITDQSRTKFYEYLNDLNTDYMKINFCGIKKLKERL